MQFGEAYEALEESLRCNPRYRSLVPDSAPAEPPRFYYSTNKYLAMNRHHDRVRDLYIAAAQVGIVALL